MRSSKFHCWRRSVSRGTPAGLGHLGGPALPPQFSEDNAMVRYFSLPEKVEFHRLQKQARSSGRCSRLILKIHRKAEEERGVNIVMFQDIWKCRETVQTQIRGYQRLKTSQFLVGRIKCVIIQDSKSISISAEHRSFSKNPIINCKSQKKRWFLFHLKVLIILDLFLSFIAVAFFNVQ